MVYEVEESYLPITLTAPAPMSDEQFIAFCDKYPDHQIEMSAEGDILIMPPAGLESSDRNNEISFQLRGWARTNRKHGMVGDSSGGFVLPNGARRSPDASWISRERVDALGPSGTRGFAHAAPNFAVELRSPTDRLQPLRRKMQEYVDNGVELGWLIDPDRRAVEIYRPSREPEIRTEIDSVQGEGPVDGFELDLRPVWEPGV